MMKFGRRATMWLVPLLLLVPPAAWAADNPPPPAQNNAPPPGSAPPPASAATPSEAAQPGPAPGTVAPSAINPDATHYTNQQLDQMLAPIALYPDKLIGQILMASTFPVEIVDAQRWLHDPKHAGLKGDALVAALQPLSWDPSVKSLAAFPRVVDLLNDNVDMTQALGSAFANQQSDVWAQVQFLRTTAQKCGNLKSNEHIAVRQEGSNIVIAPANPAVLTVPYYNPAVVYGAWPYPAYPPVFFPGTYFGIGPLAVGVTFGWGPAWPIYQPLWGWYGVGWGGGGGIFIDNGGYSRIAYGHAGWRGGNWRHAGPVGRAAFRNRGGAGQAGFRGRGAVGGPAAIHGRAGLRGGAAVRGGRHAGFRGGRAGIRHGAANRSFRGGGRGAVHRGGARARSFRGGHAAVRGGRGGFGGGGHRAAVGGGGHRGGFGGGGHRGGGGGGGHRGGGGGGGGGRHHR